MYFLFSALKFVFLTTSLSTISLNFFTSTGLIFSLSTSKSFTFVFNSFKSVGTLTGSLMSSLLLQLLNQQNLV